MSECQHCNTAIDACDQFCRNCGAKLGPPESDVIGSDQDFIVEFDDEWVSDMEEVKAVAKIAIPDNFKEVTLDHLRKRVIQAIWIKSRGIDPYSVLGIGRVETDEDRRRKAEAEAEAEAKKRERFAPPSLDEVKLQAAKIGLPEVEAEKFWNHFESNGWRVGGRSPMRKWPASLQNWNLRQREKSNTYGNNGNVNKPNPRNDGIATDPAKAGQKYAAFARRQ